MAPSTISNGLSLLILITSKHIVIQILQNIIKRNRRHKYELKHKRKEIQMLIHIFLFKFNI